MLSALLYPPRNYTPAEIAYEADARLLQPLWDKVYVSDFSYFSEISGCNLQKDCHNLSGISLHMWNF